MLMDFYFSINYSFIQYFLFFSSPLFINYFTIGFSAALLCLRNKDCPVPTIHCYDNSTLVLTQRMWTYEGFREWSNAGDRVWFPQAKENRYSPQKSLERCVYLRALIALMPPKWLRWLVWYAVFDRVQIEPHLREPRKHWDKNDFRLREWDGPQDGNQYRRLIGTISAETGPDELFCKQLSLYTELL